MLLLVFGLQIDRVLVVDGALQSDSDCRQVLTLRIHRFVQH